MSLKIVSMGKEHLKFIEDDLKSYDKFWSKDVLIDEFNNENSKYFVILDDDIVLGFAGLWFNIDEAHVMNIAIKDEFRRKSFGTKLLKFLVDVAKKERKDCITLEVREDNLPAISLYKKFDFAEVGRRKRYYDNSFDAIIMTRMF